jgi:hypothetical protein
VVATQAMLLGESREESFGEDRGSEEQVAKSMEAARRRSRSTRVIYSTTVSWICGKSREKTARWRGKR